MYIALGKQLGMRLLLLRTAEAPSMLNICLPIIPDYARSAELLIILETMPASLEAAPRHRPDIVYEIISRQLKIQLVYNSRTRTK